MLSFAVRLPDGPGLGPGFATRDSISRLAVAAERAGFDAIWATDHPAPPAPGRGQTAHDALDPFVTLASAAAVTSRIRLLTYATVLGYRNPVLLAKLASSLDVVSNGRLVLGVATGYLEREFAAVGGSFAHRISDAETAVGLLRRAWTGEPMTEAGRGWSADGNRVVPPPVQRAGPPIWVGGNSRRAIRFAVEAGDGWMPFPNPPDRVRATTSPVLATLGDLRARIDYAREHAEAVGRTTPLEIAFPPCFRETYTELVPPSRLLDSAAELEALGVGHFILQLPASTPEEVEYLLGTYGTALGLEKAHC